MSVNSESRFHAIRPELRLSRSLVSLDSFTPTPRKTRLSVPSLEPTRTRRRHTIDSLEHVRDARVKALMKAAENGRRRCSVLPPLPAEMTFTKGRSFLRAGHSRQFNPYTSPWSHTSSDSLDSSNRPARRISKEVEVKVKSHLRRSLQKRIQTMLNEELNELDHDVNSRQPTRQSERAADTPFDMFNSYTDIGEKIPKKKKSVRAVNGIAHEADPYEGDEDTPDLSKSGSLVDIPETGSGGPVVNSIDRQTPLPDIGETVDKEMTLTNGHGSAPERQISLDEAEKELQKIISQTRAATRMGEVISPVATPKLWRPETREEGRMSTQVRVDRILQGQMTVRFIPPTRLIKLFVHSAGPDSELERTALIEKTYPLLRSYALERGYDLQLLDLHWGMYDYVYDDQKNTHFLLKWLDKCKDSGFGYNFVTLLGQKYGDCVLPSSIPQQEFEAILEVVTEERRLEQIMIEARTAKLEMEEQMEKEAVKNKPIGEDTSNEDEADRKSDRSDMATGTGENKEAHVDGGSERSLSSRMSALKNAVNVVGKTAMVIRAMGKEDCHVDHESPDPSLLQLWYKLDRNARPPVYALQKVSTVYRDLLRNDAQKRTHARKAWNNTSKRLRRMLHCYAKRVVRDSSDLKKYHVSMNELELEAGILDTVEDPNLRCFWFQRQIEELEDNLSNEKAREYVDLVPDEHVFDVCMTRALHNLKDERVIKRLSPQNWRRYPVPWHTTGISKSTRAHLVYLDRLCRDFKDILSSKIDEALNEEEEQTALITPLFTEVNTHLDFCRRRCRTFHGRKDLLQITKRYIRSVDVHPLVIYGRSGNGKTALLAKAAKEAHMWLNGTCSATLVRMIGVTAASTNVRMLLRSLCLQLCHVFDKNPADVPNDYKGILNTFNFWMREATSKQPLLIFLDSLHKLTDEHDGRKLAWLPKELPQHVRLVVSCLQEEQYVCFPHLKKLMTKKKDNLVEVKEMPIEDAMTIMEYWYRQSDRRITTDQFDMITSCVAKCPIPLYLRVLYNESLLWPSSLDAEDIKMGASVKNVATVIFGRLEKDFGEPLVRRALGYLTASKNGLTDNEMEDLLSLDDVVMDDVTINMRPSLRRLPTALWLRVRDELGEYVEEVLADGFVTIQWAHSQFREAADDRYMKQRDKAPSYHKALAEYFSDKWSSVPKPFGADEEGVLRYVTPQPLYRDISLTAEKSKRVYNMRSLSELPYHLLHAQQMDLLKKDCLCNFEFILAKISSSSLRDVFEDIQAALKVEPTDADLKLLSDTLQLSSQALNKDPGQLGSQIIGRLHEMITSDQPVSLGDPVKYPAMKPFFQQTLKSSIPTLVPSMTCLTAPGGILFDVLSGHTEPITAVTITSDSQKALTTSLDNTLKVWELRTGRVVQSMTDVGIDVVNIRLGVNNTIAITSEITVIRVWNIASGQCIKRISEYSDPASLTTACDSMLLVAFFQGTDVMRVWDLEHDIDLIQEVALRGDEEQDHVAIHQDNSTIVSMYSTGAQVLHAFLSASEATVRNVKTGNVVHQLQCKESGSITALACNRDYFICAARYQYMKLQEIYFLELFDIKTGKHVRSIRGCITDSVPELYVNQLGSHAIAVCHSEVNNTSNIAAWNIETEDHKHLAHHAGVSTLAACVDLRFILTANKQENTLRIWNLSGKVNQPAPREKVKEGIEQIIPMIDNPRYVIAKSINNGPLSVWNISKGKCRGSAVRIERGLLDPNDVMLLRNTKVIILTSKGFSTVSDDGRPVFQKIIIYDLKTKKYLHKISGCFIVPSPQHEYVLLTDDRLMGLSENRSHFVIWNLQTGQVEFRIKPNFKTMERKKTEAVININDDGHLQTLKRNTSAKLAPWERRMETKTARERRHQQAIDEDMMKKEILRNEKSNAIEQYLISEDYSTIVASFYAHHICVFDVNTHAHIHTLYSENCMLFLHVATLTPDGSHLVHANYDELSKISYVTLWHCHSGTMKKRLRHEKNVCTIAISSNADTVVFGKTNKELRIWKPGRANTLKKIKGYSGLNFGVGSQIHIVDKGVRAVVFAGDISVWDLERGSVLAVFTPDMKIQCLTVSMDRLIVFGLRDRSEVVTLKLMVNGVMAIAASGENMFDEESSSDEYEDDEEVKVEEEDN